MSNINKQSLRDSAESTINILENIAGFEPSDIDGDTVELRFETEDGFDTGCDVSIVDQCQKAADVVQALLDELEAMHKYAKDRDAENEGLMITVGRLRVEKEAAEKLIAELEAREVKLPELCVGVVQGGHAVMVPYAAGHWFNKTAILEMLSDAGINIAAAGKGEAS